MPVSSEKMCERPDDALGAQAVRDHGIFTDVVGVVVIDEVESMDLPVDAQSRQRQAEANEQARFFGIGQSHGDRLESFWGGRNFGVHATGSANCLLKTFRAG